MSVGYDSAAPRAAPSDEAGVAEPLEVLHVVESWRPVVSGYTTRSWEGISAQQRGSGLDVRVLVSTRQYTYGQARVDVPSELAGRVTLMAQSSRERWARRVRPFHVERSHLVGGIERACEQHRPDVLHVHWSSGLGLCAAQVAARRAIPLVAEVRFDLAGAMMTETVRTPVVRVERALRRWFERHLSRADAVVAASDSLGELLEETFPALGPRLTVVANGVNCDVFQPGHGEPQLRQAWGLQDKLVVGSTSNMLRYEGLDVLLHALAQARAQLPQVHALLVGGGPQLARLKALAGALKVPATFTGPVPQADVPCYLRLFDLFTVPRRDASVTRYASPVKLVEAMACGLPTVGSGVGDIPTLLDGGRGVVVEPGEAKELASSIVALGADEAARRECGRHARDWVRANLSWSEAARRYRHIYKGVTSA